MSPPVLWCCVGVRVTTPDFPGSSQDISDVLFDGEFMQQFANVLPRFELAGLCTGWEKLLRRGLSWKEKLKAVITFVKLLRSRVGWTGHESVVDVWMKGNKEKGICQWHWHQTRNRNSSLHRNQAVVTVVSWSFSCGFSGLGLFSHCCPKD